MSWDREFDEAVPLPGGREARTLREAGNYVLSLSKSNKAHERWQNAANALQLVVEHNGPLMFARMALMAALHKDKAPAALSERKDKVWGRRPLKRDQ